LKFLGEIRCALRVHVWSGNIRHELNIFSAFDKIMGNKENSGNILYGRTKVTRGCFHYRPTGGREAARTRKDGKEKKQLQKTKP
jgi:hypothetical protein